ncbi:MAG: hypothetical protein ACREMY_19350, partial [bacterium]
RDGHTVLKGWPLFAQFMGGEQPSFLHAMRRNRGLHSSSLTTEKSFVLNGGPASSITLEIAFGTEKSAGRTARAVRLSVETTRKTGGSFFFIVLADSAL